MAAKIKIIAPGDFLEITPGGAMIYDKTVRPSIAILGKELSGLWRDC